MNKCDSRDGKYRDQEWHGRILLVIEGVAEDSVGMVSEHIAIPHSLLRIGF